MAALNLHTLNSDVLCEVLFSCSNLSDLHCLILTHPNIYQTFNAHRRLILRTVFRHQHRKLHLLRNKRQQNEAQKSMELFFTKLKCKNPLDQVALREALSQNYLYNTGILKDRTWRWATSLLKWYETAGQRKDALQLAEKILKTAVHNPLLPGIENDRMFKTMVRIYCDEDRLEELVALLQVTRPAKYTARSTHTDQVMRLVDIYRMAGEAYSTQLLELLTENWNMYCAHIGPDAEFSKSLARELIALYTSKHQDREALLIAETVRNATPPGSSPYIGWSNIMQRSYRQLNDDAGLLRIMEEVWRSLQPDSKWYKSATDSLGQQYETAGRSADAVRTWKIAWVAVSQNVANLPHQNAWKFRGKQAALSLAAAYRRCGRLNDAAAIQARCSELGITI